MRRGVDLRYRGGNHVKEAHVVVSTSEMEGATVSARNADDGNDGKVIHWNQEVRFIGVKPREKILDVHVYENNSLVSKGECRLPKDHTEGVVIVQMHDVHAHHQNLG